MDTQIEDSVIVSGESRLLAQARIRIAYVY
jgi:hypothetical protein